MPRSGKVLKKPLYSKLKNNGPLIDRISKKHSARRKEILRLATKQDYSSFISTSLAEKLTRVQPKRRTKGNELIFFFTFKEINEFASYNGQTPEFVEEIRKKLFLLHEYNSHVAKVTYSYPTSKELYELLGRYVALESDVFYKNQTSFKYERTVENRVFLTIYSFINNSFSTEYSSLNDEGKHVYNEALKVFVSYVDAKYTHDEDKFPARIVKNILDKLGLIKKSSDDPSGHLDLNNPSLIKLKESLKDSDYGSDDDGQETTYVSSESSFMALLSRTQQTENGKDISNDDVDTCNTTSANPLDDSSNSNVSVQCFGDIFREEPVLSKNVTSESSQNSSIDVNSTNETNQNDRGKLLRIWEEISKNDLEVNNTGSEVPPYDSSNSNLSLRDILLEEPIISENVANESSQNSSIDGHRSDPEFLFNQKDISNDNVNLNNTNSAVPPNDSSKSNLTVRSSKDIIEKEPRISGNGPTQNSATDSQNANKISTLKALGSEKYISNDDVVFHYTSSAVPLSDSSNSKLSLTCSNDILRKKPLISGNGSNQPSQNSLTDSRSGNWISGDLKLSFCQKDIRNDGMDVYNKNSTTPCNDYLKFDLILRGAKDNLIEKPIISVKVTNESIQNSPIDDQSGNHLRNDQKLCNSTGSQSKPNFPTSNEVFSSISNGDIQTFIDINVDDDIEVIRWSTKTSKFPQPHFENKKNISLPKSKTERLGDKRNLEYRIYDTIYVSSDGEEEEEDFEENSTDFDAIEKSLKQQKLKQGLLSNIRKELVKETNKIDINRGDVANFSQGKWSSVCSREAIALKEEIINEDREDNITGIKNSRKKHHLKSPKIIESNAAKHRDRCSTNTDVIINISSSDEDEQTDPQMRVSSNVYSKKSIQKHPILPLNNGDNSMHQNPEQDNFSKSIITPKPTSMIQSVDDLRRIENVPVIEKNNSSAIIGKIYCRSLDELKTNEKLTGSCECSYFLSAESIPSTKVAEKSEISKTHSIGGTENSKQVLKNCDFEKNNKLISDSDKDTEVIIIESNLTDHSKISSNQFISVENLSADSKKPCTKNSSFEITTLLGHNVADEVHEKQTNEIRKFMPDDNSTTGLPEVIENIPELKTALAQNVQKPEVVEIITSFDEHEEAPLSASSRMSETIQSEKSKEENEILDTGSSSTSQSDCVDIQNTNKKIPEPQTEISTLTSSKLNNLVNSVQSFEKTSSEAQIISNSSDAVNILIDNNEQKTFVPQKNEANVGNGGVQTDKTEDTILNESDSRSSSKSLQTDNHEIEIHNKQILFEKEFSQPLNERTVSTFEKTLENEDHIREFNYIEVEISSHDNTEHLNIHKESVNKNSQTQFIDKIIPENTKEKNRTLQCNQSSESIFASVESQVKLPEETYLNKNKFSEFRGNSVCSEQKVENQDSDCSMSTQELMIQTVPSMSGEDMNFCGKQNQTNERNSSILEGSTPSKEDNDQYADDSKSNEQNGEKQKVHRTISTHKTSGNSEEFSIHSSSFEIDERPQIEDSASDTFRESVSITELSKVKFDEQNSSEDNRNSNKLDATQLKDKECEHWGKLITSATTMAQINKCSDIIKDNIPQEFDDECTSYIIDEGEIEDVEENSESNDLPKIKILEDTVIVVENTSISNSDNFDVAKLDIDSSNREEASTSFCSETPNTISVEIIENMASTGVELPNHDSPQWSIPIPSNIHLSNCSETNISAKNVDVSSNTSLDKAEGEVPKSDSYAPEDCIPLTSNIHLENCSETNISEKQVDVSSNPLLNKAEGGYFTPKVAKSRGSDSHNVVGNLGKVMLLMSNTEPRRPKRNISFTSPIKMNDSCAIFDTVPVANNIIIDNVTRDVTFNSYTADTEINSTSKSSVLGDSTFSQCDQSVLFTPNKFYSSFISKDSRNKEILFKIEECESQKQQLDIDILASVASNQKPLEVDIKQRDQKSLPNQSNSPKNEKHVKIKPTPCDSSLENSFHSDVVLSNTSPSKKKSRSPKTNYKSSKADKKKDLPDVIPGSSKKVKVTKSRDVKLNLSEPKQRKDYKYNKKIVKNKDKKKSKGVKLPDKAIKIKRETNLEKKLVIDDFDSDDSLPLNVRMKKNELLPEENTLMKKSRRDATQRNYSKSKFSKSKDKIKIKQSNVKKKAQEEISGFLCKKEKELGAKPQIISNNPEKDNVTTLHVKEDRTRRIVHFKKAMLELISQDLDENIQRNSTMNESKETPKTDILGDNKLDEKVLGTSINTNCEVNNCLSYTTDMDAEKNIESGLRNCESEVIVKYEEIMNSQDNHPAQKEPPEILVFPKLISSNIPNDFAVVGIQASSGNDSDHFGQNTFNLSNQSNKGSLKKNEAISILESERSSHIVPETINPFSNPPKSIETSESMKTEVISPKEIKFEVASSGTEIDSRDAGFIGKHNEKEQLGIKKIDKLRPMNKIESEKIIDRPPQMSLSKKEERDEIESPLKAQEKLMQGETPKSKRENFGSFKLLDTANNKPCQGMASQNKLKENVIKSSDSPKSPNMKISLPIPVDQVSKNKSTHFIRTNNKEGRNSSNQSDLGGEPSKSRDRRKKKAKTHPRNKNRKMQGDIINDMEPGIEKDITLVCTKNKTSTSEGKEDDTIHLQEDMKKQKHRKLNKKTRILFDTKHEPVSLNHPLDVTRNAVGIKEQNENKLSAENIKNNEIHRKGVTVGSNPKLSTSEEKLTSKSEERPKRSKRKILNNATSEKPNPIRSDNNLFDGDEEVITEGKNNASNEESPNNIVVVSDSEKVSIDSGSQHQRKIHSEKNLEKLNSEAEFIHQELNEQKISIPIMNNATEPTPEVENIYSVPLDEQLSQSSKVFTDSGIKRADNISQFTTLKISEVNKEKNLKEKEQGIFDISLGTKENINICPESQLSSSSTEATDLGIMSESIHEKTNLTNSEMKCETDPGIYVIAKKTNEGDVDTNSTTVDVNSIVSDVKEKNTFVERVKEAENLESECINQNEVSKELEVATDDISGDSSALRSTPEDFNQIVNIDEEIGTHKRPSDHIRRLCSKLKNITLKSRKNDEIIENKYMERDEQQSPVLGSENISNSKLSKPEDNNHSTSEFYGAVTDSCVHKNPYPSVADLDSGNPLRTDLQVSGQVFSIEKEIISTTASEPLLTAGKHSEHAVDENVFVEKRSETEIHLSGPVSLNEEVNESTSDSEMQQKVEKHLTDLSVDTIVETKIQVSELVTPSEEVSDSINVSDLPNEDDLQDVKNKDLSIGNIIEAENPVNEKILLGNAKDESTSIPQLLESNNHSEDDYSVGQIIETEEKGFKQVSSNEENPVPERDESTSVSQLLESNNYSEDDLPTGQTIETEIEVFEEVSSNEEHIKSVCDSEVFLDPGTHLENSCIEVSPTGHLPESEISLSELVSPNEEKKNSASILQLQLEEDNTSKNVINKDLIVGTIIDNEIQLSAPVSPNEATNESRCLQLNLEADDQSHNVINEEISADSIIETEIYTSELFSPTEDENELESESLIPQTSDDHLDISKTTLLKGHTVQEIEDNGLQANKTSIEEELQLDNSEAENCSQTDDSTNPPLGEQIIITEITISEQEQDTSQTITPEEGPSLFGITEVKECSNYKRKHFEGKEEIENCIVTKRCNTEKIQNEIIHPTHLETNEVKEELSRPETLSTITETKQENIKNDEFSHSSVDTYVPFNECMDPENEQILIISDKISKNPILMEDNLGISTDTVEENTLILPGSVTTEKNHILESGENLCLTKIETISSSDYQETQSSACSEGVKEEAANEKVMSYSENNISKSIQLPSSATSSCQEQLEIQTLNPSKNELSFSIERMLQPTPRYQQKENCDNPQSKVAIEIVEKVDSSSTSEKQNIDIIPKSNEKSELFKHPGTSNHDNLILKKTKMAADLENDKPRKMNIKEKVDSIFKEEENCKVIVERVYSMDELAGGTPISTCLNFCSAPIMPISTELIPYRYGVYSTVNPHAEKNDTKDSDFQVGIKQTSPIKSSLVDAEILSQNMDFMPETKTDTSYERTNRRETDILSFDKGVKSSVDNGNKAESEIVEPQCTSINEITVPALSENDIEIVQVEGQEHCQSEFHIMKNSDNPTSQRPPFEHDNDPINNKDDVEQSPVPSLSSLSTKTVHYEMEQFDNIVKGVNISLSSEGIEQSDNNSDCRADTTRTKGELHLNKKESNKIIESIIINGSKHEETVEKTESEFNSQQPQIEVPILETSSTTLKEANELSQSQQLNVNKSTPNDEAVVGVETIDQKQKIQEESSEIEPSINPPFVIDQVGSICTVKFDHGNNDHTQYPNNSILQSQKIETTKADFPQSEVSTLFSNNMEQQDLSENFVKKVVHSSGSEGMESLLTSFQSAISDTIAQNISSLQGSFSLFSDNSNNMPFAQQNGVRNEEILQVNFQEKSGLPMNQPEVFITNRLNLPQSTPIRSQEIQQADDSIFNMSDDIFDFDFNSVNQTPAGSTYSNSYVNTTMSSENLQMIFDNPTEFLHLLCNLNDVGCEVTVDNTNVDDIVAKPAEYIASELISEQLIDAIPPYIPEEEFDSNVPTDPMVGGQKELVPDPKQDSNLDEVPFPESALSFDEEMMHRYALFLHCDVDTTGQSSTTEGVNQVKTLEESAESSAEVSRNIKKPENITIDQKNSNNYEEKMKTVEKKSLTGSSTVDGTKHVSNTNAPSEINKQTEITVANTQETIKKTFDSSPRTITPNSSVDINKYTNKIVEKNPAKVQKIPASKYAPPKKTKNNETQKNKKQQEKADIKQPRHSINNEKNKNLTLDLDFNNSLDMPQLLSPSENTTWKSRSIKSNDKSKTETKTCSSGRQEVSVDKKFEKLSEDDDSPQMQYNMYDRTKAMKRNAAMVENYCKFYDDGSTSLNKNKKRKISNKVESGSHSSSPNTKDKCSGRRDLPNEFETQSKKPKTAESFVDAPKHIGNSRLELRDSIPREVKNPCVRDLNAEFDKLKNSGPYKSSPSRNIKYNRTDRILRSAQEGSSSHYQMSSSSQYGYTDRGKREDRGKRDIADAYRKTEDLRRKTKVQERPRSPHSRSSIHTSNLIDHRRDSFRRSKMMEMKRNDGWYEPYPTSDDRRRTSEGHHSRDLHRKVDRHKTFSSRPHSNQSQQKSDSKNGDELWDKFDAMWPLETDVYKNTGYTKRTE